MRKLVAIYLIITLLYNFAGPLIIRQYLAYRTEKHFNEQTSKGLYYLGDLTEVVIPVELPGIADWVDYEDISGQIQFQNNRYNYVKMKLTQHAMYLLCVPNYEETRLNSQNIISAKKVKEVPVPKKDHTPTFKVTLLGEFQLAAQDFCFIAPIKSNKAPLGRSVESLFKNDLDVPDRPPQNFC